MTWSFDRLIPEGENALAAGKAQARVLMPWLEPYSPRAWSDVILSRKARKQMLGLSSLSKEEQGKALARLVVGTSG